MRCFLVIPLRKQLVRTNERTGSVPGFFSVYVCTHTHILFRQVYKSTCTLLVLWTYFQSFTCVVMDICIYRREQTIFFYIRLYCVEVWYWWDNAIWKYKCIRETWSQRITDVRTCIPKAMADCKIKLIVTWDFLLLLCKNFFLISVRVIAYIDILKF